VSHTGVARLTVMRADGSLGELAGQPVVAVGLAHLGDDAAVARDLEPLRRRAMRDARAVAATRNHVNDLGETEEHDLAAVYGPARYERLLALKRTRDPDNVFRLNQNIR
jgi:FAD/FMN-containing dehydrogenase